MIKCIIGTVIVSAPTALLVYYITRAVDIKIVTRDAQTQTHTHMQNDSNTPPNETNLPDFISVEHPSPTDNTNVRRSRSFASFFNYLRNIT